MRRLAPSTSAVWLFALLAPAVLVAPIAYGAAYHLEARTEAQAYQLRAFRGTDPSRPLLLPRRRLVQYLGLNVYELVTGQPFSFESSLRVFADFGLTPEEASALTSSESAGADLLLAAITYRGTPLSLTVGRQAELDLMDYLTFDGLKAGYRLPFGLSLEVYGGFWTKGNSLWGSSVHQPDGVLESDLTQGAGQLDDFEPVYGARVAVAPIAGVSGSVGYRTALLGGKTDLERVLAQARFDGIQSLVFLGGLELDLITRRVSQLRLLGRVDRRLFAASLELFRVSPVLSSDSIFLYFASAPRDGVRLRGDLTPPGPLRVFAQASMDLYSAPVRDENLRVALSGSGAGRSLGGGGGAALELGEVHLGVDLTTKAGVGGRQLWGDLTASYSPDHRLHRLGLRASVASITDDVNPLLKGVFLAGQVFGGVALTRGASASVVLEQSINRFTRSETKGFLLLDLKAAL